MMQARKGSTHAHFDEAGFWQAAVARHPLDELARQGNGAARRLHEWTGTALTAPDLPRNLEGVPAPAPEEEAPGTFTDVPRLQPDEYYWTGEHSKNKRRVKPVPGRRCCPDKFEYPIEKSAAFAEVKDGRGTKFAYKFEVLATFKPSSPTNAEEKDCACECCVFFQAASFELQRNGRNVAMSLAYTQDCIWTWLSEMAGPGGATTAKWRGSVEDPPPVGPNGETTVMNPETNAMDTIVLKCYGDVRDVGVGAPVPQAYSQSQCSYWMCDTPGIGPSTDNLVYTAKLLGQIRDACNAYVVLREGKIEFEVRVGPGTAQGFLVPKGGGIPRLGAGGKEGTTAWPKAAGCEKASPPPGDDKW